MSLVKWRMYNFSGYADDAPNNNRLESCYFVVSLQYKERTRLKP